MISLPVAETFPLSGMQHAMVAHTLLAPGSGVEILQLEIHLREQLDISALREGLRRAVARHAVLRTAFRWRGLEQPLQEVLAEVELPFTEEVLGGLDAATIEARIEGFLEKDRLRGFDPGVAPLHRIHLFQVAPREHRLIWTFHHALVDGRSIRVVVAEVLATHDALVRGVEPEIAEVRPYKDYLEWLKRQDPGRSRAFWREALAGFPAPTPAPLARTARETIRGYGMCERALCRDDTALLQDQCSAQRITMGTLLQGAWAKVISCFAGEADVVFGIARACRRTALLGEGTATMVGLMINTLPLRASVDPDAPLFSWLRDLRARARAMGNHEHTPLLVAKGESKLAPNQPLFETLVVYEEKLIDEVLAPRGASARFRNGPSVPLMLSGYGGEELRLKLTYERARYDAADAEALLGHVATLLASIAAADLAICLGALSMIGDAERATLLSTWNDTARDFPRETALEALFEAQVDRTPDALAVIFEGRTLSYGQLDERANRLARRLQRAGVGPGSTVGLHVSRSLDLVVAPLAVLKAGGAYVPLDPEYPAARLRAMIEDSRAPVIVSSGRLPEDLALPGVSLVRLDQERDALADEDPRRLPSLPGGERRAYVIYTSGSTGTPKGVEIPHRALTNFLLSMRESPGLAPTDRLLAVTSLSFDIAGLELFLPLITGAEVEVASRALTMDGSALRDRLERSAITVMQATPSTFRLLVDAGFSGGPGFTALVGGEAVPSELCARLLPCARAVWNMYGPTETTIWSTVHPLDSAAPPVLVGRPIANTTIFVLDERRALLPIGAIGQVYIGGDGLALGYLGKPELTAARFVHGPVGAGAEARIYATGDRGRFTRDGALEVLGRLDHQVKIRGHRIELGEIEAVMAAHPRVSHALVTAEGARLVGYLVPLDPRAPPSPGEVRAHLQDRLPSYMIPSAFVPLRALPLLPNGKVDRASLPAPEAAHRGEHVSFVGPSNALEADLIALWEEVLEVRPIGAHDDFFELGGHSMLAARLFDRIESRIGRRLPLATLLAAPTVARLAGLLGQEGWSPSWGSLVAIQPGGARPPFFCVHAIGGNVLNYRMLSRYLGEDQPFYGLQARGLDGGPAPVATVEEMAAAYLDEIRSVQPHGPYRLGGASAGGVVAYEMAQQLVRRGEEVSLLVLMDTVLAGVSVGSATERPRAYAIDLHLGQLLLRPRAEWGDYLLERARARVGSIADEVARSLGRPARRAPTTVERITARDRAAMRAYVPSAYPGPITLFVSRDEPSRTAQDRRLLWADMATSGLTIHFVPGVHDTILEEPAVGEVAKYLAASLERVAPR